MNFLSFLTNTQDILNFKLMNSKTSLVGSKVDISKASAFRKVTSTSGSQTNLLIQPQNSQCLAKIVEERQKLINQYLQLNIQMLQREIKENDTKKEICQKKDMEQILEKKDELKIDNCLKLKKIKKINNCEHQDRPHYAKGMCSNCYHRYGRLKKPWKCPHDKLYAAGLCQNCYINDYNKRRREEIGKNIDSQELQIELNKNEEQKPINSIESSAFS